MPPGHPTPESEDWRWAAARYLCGAPEDAVLTAPGARLAAGVLAKVWHVAPTAVPAFLTRHGASLAMANVTLLEALAEASLAQGRLFRRVALGVIAAFEDADVPLVALKGTAAGYRYYAEPARRSGADLDFCVWPKDVERAKEILARLGFAAMEYDPATRAFSAADPIARAKMEAGHYELGYWVRLERLEDLPPKTVEGFKLGADLLAAASRIEGACAIVPVIVDIHHALSLDISCDGVMAGAKRRPVPGGSCLLPPPEWMALHAILKLYWEGGQAYGVGFQYLADLGSIVPALSEEEAEALAALVEAYDLRAGGYYVLRRLPGVTGRPLPEPLRKRLETWARPGKGETPKSYNDIGDIWPRLFGTL